MKRNNILLTCLGVFVCSLCAGALCAGGRFISASAATESGLSMSAGASIRLNEPSGVKFQAVLPAAEYRAEDNYGFLIVPNDYFQRRA